MILIIFFSFFVDIWDHGGRKELCAQFVSKQLSKKREGRDGGL